MSDVLSAYLWHSLSEKGFPGRNYTCFTFEEWGWSILAVSRKCFLLPLWWCKVWKACARGRVDSPIRIQEICRYVSQMENISRESTQAELSVNFCGIRCENPFSLLHRQWLRRSRCVAMLLMPDGQEYHIRQSVSIRAGKFLPALMRFPENIPFHSADSKIWSSYRLTLPKRISRLSAV